MPSYGSSQLAFPAFRGATRRLILWNLAAYFGLLVLGYVLPVLTHEIEFGCAFTPSVFLHGDLWQPLTYSFVHTSMMGTLMELLSLWFVAGFLENYHSADWVLGLYFTSVVGTAVTALVISLCASMLGLGVVEMPLMGCFGGIFGLMGAIGLLYGDTQFLMFFVIGIKARHLVIIYTLLILAMLFSQQRAYAFAQLGGLLAGLFWAKYAPQRGFSFHLSESLYGLRNRYYRWKRRRAARKFEVYMRKQGRTVRFDGNGRQIRDDEHNDRSRWN